MSTPDVVILSTELLRTSEGAIYRRLRELLDERGIPANESMLVQWHPEDTNIERGVLVTDRLSVIEFEVEYGRGDLTKQALTATVSAWEDRTSDWHSMAEADDVRRSREILRSERAT